MAMFPRSLLAGLLLLGIPHAVEACSFTFDLGDGSTLATGGIENFNTAPGATTTCVVSCASGSATSLYLKYGGPASLLDHDSSSIAASSCGARAVIASTSEEYTLGWQLNVGSAYVGLKLECSCSSAGDGDDRLLGGACFSESAEAHVLGKGVVPMKDLAVGDRVLTGGGRYSPIYSFGHKEATVEKEFLQIHTEELAKNAPLELTDDHMLFVMTKNGSEEAVRAGSIQVGDRLVRSNDQLATVTEISIVTKQGIYMPLTLDGTIVVDDIKASSYISIADQSPRFLSLRAYTAGLFSEQRIFHWWLSPLRTLCMGVSSKFCTTGRSAEDDQDILSWLETGRLVLQFGDRQNLFVQVCFLAFPIFVVFGILNLVETTFGAGLAPTVLAATVAALMWMKRTRRSSDGGARVSKKLD